MITKTMWKIDRIGKMIFFCLQLNVVKKETPTELQITVHNVSVTKETTLPGMRRVMCHNDNDQFLPHLSIGFYFILIWPRRVYYFYKKPNYGCTNSSFMERSAER